MMFMAEVSTNASITFLQGRRNGADTGTTTIATTTNGGPANYSAGTPSDDRYLIAVFQCGTGTATGISAATLGGVAATKLLEIGASGDGFISIWGAYVPTGTTATVSGTVSGSANYTALHLYEVHGLDSVTPVDTYSSNGGASATLTATLDAVEGGIVLAVYNAFNSSASHNVAWSGTTGVTEQFDEASVGTGIVASGAVVNSTSAITNATAICNPGSTTSSEKIAAISMR